MEEERVIGVAYKGLLVVSFPKRLMQGAKIGTAGDKAVLYLPERGYYLLWITQDGPDVYQHYAGPYPDPPPGYKEGPGHIWEPYSVARIFGMSSKEIRL